MMRQIAMAVVAVLALGVGLWGLEAPRAGLEVRHDRVGETPVTVMQRPGAEGPVVVISHGFAGSRQLMAAWQLTLARAGLITVSFDFEGHGRNPVPMSGDVTSIDGTTRLLMSEMGRVTDYAVGLPGAEPRVALLGHSMASDVIIRQGLEDPRVSALVAISVFSQAITDEVPENLLMVNGAWEAMLREEARRVMGALGAEEGETVGTPGEGFARRAVAVPFAEHVGVLYAGPGIAEAEAWIGETFDLRLDAAPVRLGPWIVLTFLGVVLLSATLARWLPEGPAPDPIPKRAFWTAALLPAILTPLLLAPLDTRFLPVLVADYVAVHLALYGALVLGLLMLLGVRIRHSGWLWGLALAGFGILVFGGLLHRYVGSFWPHPGRLEVILAILPGAVLAMLGDAALSQATTVSLWRRIAARVAFLGSLALAVTLDFERLFFLIIILPVILLYYGTYGMMGRFVGRRTGSVAAVGLGLGMILGWALGVTFPMFDASL